MKEINAAKPNESLLIGLAVHIMFPFIKILEMHL